DAAEWNSLVRSRVPFAAGDRAVLERVDVDGHAPRRPDLVLAAGELPDRGRVVADGHSGLSQVGAELPAQVDDFRTLLQQRQHRHLVRRQLRMEAEDNARLTSDLFLAAGVAEER